MHNEKHRSADLADKLPFRLLALLLVILCIAGGASRADVLGQTVVRTASWAVAIIVILFAATPRWRPVAPVALFMTAIILVTALQLVPLPPALWIELPGRNILAEAAAASGQTQPWRPLSISPDGTINALSSLIVPASILLLLAGMRPHDQRRIIVIVLATIAVSSVIAALQFAGARFDNILINDVAGAVSGLFANRNHFALFAAIGCLLTPAWGLQDVKQKKWKIPVATAMFLFFNLIILASGSRAGLILGLVGSGLGLLIVRQQIGTMLRKLQRRTAILLVALAAGLLGGSILLSVSLDRAASINRAFSIEASDDMRVQIFPVVVDLIAKYFPFGTGFGTFDPVYRIDEPTGLLIPFYVNHAHNDLAEIILDGGLAGAVLLLAGISWWLWRSATVMRNQTLHGTFAKLGAGIVLLVLIASLIDFPARTPMIMALLVISSLWLAGDLSGAEKPAKKRQ